MNIIGIYCLTNTASILVHDVQDDKILISLNNIDPEWVDIVYEDEVGFYWGEMFVPLSEVLRSC